jgi:Holliday junction resolvase
VSIYRRNPRRDTVEPEIIEALEKLGAKVVPLSGRGIPDLLVGYRRLTRLAECKTGKAKLTDDQAEFHKHWTGSPIAILRDATDAAYWILTLDPHAIAAEEAARKHTLATETLDDC